MASKKVVVVVGGGKSPRRFDISTPPPRAVAIPCPLPQVGKPALEWIEEIYRDAEAKFLAEPDPTDPEEP
jgi:hypothetical protein